MTDLLSASVSLGVKNKREISWKKISQPQTPPCLSLSSNLPSPVVWDLDWILYCADLSAHLPVPEHSYTSCRDRGTSTELAWCERLGLLEGLLYSAPAACTFICTSHGHGFLWISHCFCEMHIFLPKSMSQEWNKLCLCSVGAPAALPWGLVFTAETVSCFLRGSSHAGLVQKTARNSLWNTGSVKPELQILT